MIREMPGYIPDEYKNMKPEQTYEEKMQAEREAFDSRISDLAQELNVDKEELIQTYAIEEDTMRHEHPDEPASIYEAGPGSRVLEKSMQNAILERIKGGRDSLTGIDNRISFDQEVERRREEVKEHGEFSMIMIDIDKFKNVNDTYGHQAGDYVLKEVASVLKKSMRKGDLLARYGGEEMVVIAPNANGSAADFAERLRRMVEKTNFEYDGQEIKVTISAGVSPYYEDFKQMKTTSDMGLYLAKGEGAKLIKGVKVEPGHEGEETRNQVWFFDTQAGTFRRK